MTQQSAPVARPVSPHRPDSRESVSRLAPAALLALMAIPLTAGSLRVLEIAGGPQVLPANPRIEASPVPLVLHVAASATATSILLGFTAIRRRDVAAHRAWMIRAYALAVAAGTQAFTQGVGEGVFGTSDLSTGLSLSSGWLVNGAVAEWVIRRPGARRGRRARITAARS